MQGGIPLNGHRTPPRRKQSSADDCLSRVPYASVMAFIMCAIGVILFAIMMAWAFNASIEQTRRSLNIDRLPWLSKVHVFFLAVAIIMAIVALILLTIGAMSTGATRTEFFRGVQGRLGGRIANIIAMLFAYLSNICWLLAFASTAILCFVYWIFNHLCSSLSSFSESSCLDFSLFRPLTYEFSSSTLKLCGGDLQQFCALTSTAYAWYIVGLVGSLIIVLGLVHYLMCAAANYAHVSFGLKSQELKELIMSNDMEGLSYATAKQDYYGVSDRRPSAALSRPLNYYRP